MGTGKPRGPYETNILTADIRAGPVPPGAIFDQVPRWIKVVRMRFLNAMITNHAGTLFWIFVQLRLKEIKLLNGFPFWPSLLSVLGPAILVAALTRRDGVGVYAAGIIVTLIGWSQLACWFHQRR